MVIMEEVVKFVKSLEVGDEECRYIDVAVAVAVVVVVVDGRSRTERNESERYECWRFGASKPKRGASVCYDVILVLPYRVTSP